MRSSRYLTYDGVWYTCTLCDRRFGNQASIHDHWKFLHDWCERCSQVFASPSGKKAHLRDSSAHNFCADCNIDFEADEQLEDHDVAYHNLCVECEIFFDSEEDLDEHNVECHNYCLECDLFFDSKDELQDHDINQHHLCPDCDSFYESAEILENHDVEYHNLCIECGKFLSNQNSLIQVIYQN